MRPEMTAQQAEALAAYLVTLRPGQRDWTKTACVDHLRVAAANITRDTELITRAAVRAALTATIRTPQVIGMRGAHWDAGDQLETRGEGAKADRCAGCGDVHTRLAPCRRGGPTVDHRRHVELMREGLARARADQRPEEAAHA